MELLHRGEFISRAVCDDILAMSARKSPEPSAIGSALQDGTPVAT